MFQSRNPAILWAIPVLFVVCLVSFPAQAKYSGGTGEPNDPYQIATAADLIALGETPGDYDKHFLLTADIDLDPNLPGRKVFDKAVIAPDTDQTKNWFQGTPFTGVFDGNGRTILHLAIMGGGHLGLFGQLGSWDEPPFGEIMNLGLVYVNITGSGERVGGLVAHNYGDVTQCFSVGVVCGDSCVGGLVGVNDWYSGVVSQSYSTATVRGSGYVGGLVGDNWSVVTDCHSAGPVSGSSYVGGLVGGNAGDREDGIFGTVTHCYSAGAVSGTEAVGGLVGANGGDVTQCYSTGTVGGVNSVGGLVGYNGWDVTRCYSVGAVSGDSDVGGLVGITFLGGRVVECYSAGVVSGNKHIGGLIGESGCGGSLRTCFWDTQASGMTNMCGAKDSTSAGCNDQYGRRTAEMQRANTFLEAGWDFVGETANGMEDIWKIAEGLGYPRLSWEKYSGGTGEPNDPYQIATAADLIALGETPEDYDKHFILTADIDLDPNLPGRKVFDKAVIAPHTNDATATHEVTSFSGVFDGGGHRIRHLTIRGHNYLGLFGLLATDGWDPSGARVRNVGVVDVNITGSGSCVGGLVGAVASNQYGTIDTSYTSGSVSGREDVGGLVGYNELRGIVKQCYSSANVSGDNNVGGLVGQNGGEVSNCYSTKTVSGGTCVGGLVGANWMPWWRGERLLGRVVQCYSSGAVCGSEDVGGLVGSCGWGDAPPGVRVYSFWDTQRSGQTTSCEGTGKTTAEMQTAKTFLDAGWDFVGETTNGGEDIWKIAEGLDYPRLWWEPYDGQVTRELGQVFTVTLESNPSTGYHWEWVAGQESIIEQVGKTEFKQPETGGPPLVGAGGWEIFNFKAVSRGQMILKLVYRRPWEEGVDPLKIFLLQVVVPSREPTAPRQEHQTPPSITQPDQPKPSSSS